MIQPTFLPAKSRPKRPNGTDLTERAQHRGAFMQQDVTSEFFGQSKPDAVGHCLAGRLTTHAIPTYEVDGVTHYCVADVPGAVPALTDLQNSWAAAKRASPSLGLLCQPATLDKRLVDVICAVRRAVGVF